MALPSLPMYVCVCYIHITVNYQGSNFRSEKKAYESEFQSIWTLIGGENTYTTVIFQTIERQKGATAPHYLCLPSYTYVLPIQHKYISSTFPQFLRFP